MYIIGHCLIPLDPCDANKYDYPLEDRTEDYVHIIKAPEGAYNHEAGVHWNNTYLSFFQNCIFIGSALLFNNDIVCYQWRVKTPLEQVIRKNK